MKQVSKTRRLIFRFTKVLVAGVGLGLAFQNCSSVKFSPEELASSESPAGVTQPETIVCDPFSPGSLCAESTGGLLGNVYHLPNARGSVQEYIDNGTKLNILVQMTNLNIPDRDWTAGFPGGDGLIKDLSGEPLIEYFALDLKGFLKLTPNQLEGDYQFALASDDGAILDLDGQEVVNNDGEHGIRWACSTTIVSLKTNVIHAMRLRYYQGPRYKIALQVYYRPAARSNLPCNEQGNWEILPAGILYH
jgi:hypothetical protein